MLDVLVLTSIYEGLPNVIMEAMAMKKPVVTTNVGGCAELVDDKINGFITRPKDYKDTADKILSLLNDKDLRHKMGEAGFCKIREEFSSEIMVAKIENLYKELLKSKIAFIMPQFPRYDETFILREILELKRQGLDMLILSLKMPKDKIIHEQSRELIDSVINLPFVFSFQILWTNLYFLARHPIKYLGCVFFILTRFIKSPAMLTKSLAVFPKTVCFAKIARNENIKLAYGYWATTPTVSAMVLSRLLNIPYGFTGHAHDIYVDTTGLKEKIEKARFILTCTADNKRHLLELYNNEKSQSKPKRIADKIIVNYHGLDLAKFCVKHSKTHSANERLRILSVGSLLPCKGFDVLIAACEILRKKGINFECTIAGGGPLEQTLKKRVKDLGLDTCMRFTGYITQDRLIPLYQKSDIFALPARLDIHWGIPNVLLEAMACGIPPITTNLPSIPELIQDKHNGLIIPDKNPQALADCIFSLYSDRSRLQILGNQAQKTIMEKFDIQTNARTIKEIFDNFLESQKCISCNSFNIKRLIYAKDINHLQDIFICKRCGLIFFEDTSNGKFYDWESKIYWQPKSKQWQIYEKKEIASAFDKEFENRIKKINTLMPNKGNLLDIGCGRGRFLKIASDNGWECAGLDVSKEAVAHIRNNLKIEAFCEQIKDCRLPDNHFAVVTMWDVLEHLQNPIEDLKIIYKKLKPNGILAIKTPNEASLFKRMGKFIYKSSLGLIRFQLKYMYYSPHYYYYSPKSLSRILNAIGFRIINTDFDETDLKFAKSKIKQHYGKFASSKMVSFFLEPAYTLSRLLKMQNKMLVYARKS
jgi:glycosyltransferase involved in cell wall biosynthesis/2-polyprenyl-3-methyl-5-hydroxy-6-metoxy-1,4-benzoquinol methylase